MAAEKNFEDSLNKSVKDLDVVNEILNKTVQATGKQPICNFFMGDNTSVAPLAQHQINYYGNDAMSLVNKSAQDLAVVQAMTDEQRRLCVYFSDVNHVKMLCVILAALPSVNELARLIISWVKSGGITAEEAKKEEFLNLLISFCKKIKKSDSLNARNLRAHMQRLLSSQSGEEGVKLLSEETSEKPVSEEVTNKETL